MSIAWRAILAALALPCIAAMIVSVVLRELLAKKVA